MLEKLFNVLYGGSFCKKIEKIFSNLATSGRLTRVKKTLFLSNNRFILSKSYKLCIILFKDISLISFEFDYCLGRFAKITMVFVKNKFVKR